LFCFVFSNKFASNLHKNLISILVNHDFYWVRFESLKSIYPITFKIKIKISC
jgi:hypothetical protein